MPVISVIVPVYNTEKYLRRCVDSILAQTFTDFELILVDDGSTDGSGSLCDSFSDEDKRIKVIHKPNGGVSSARNVGIEQATGEWLYFADADDELYLNSLSYLINRTSASGIDMVMAGYENYNDSGDLLYSVTEREESIISKNEALKLLFAPKYYYYLGFLWNKIIRHSIVKENSLRFNEAIYFNEDRLFSFEYLLCCQGKVCFCTEPIYRYYHREGSAIASVTTSFNPKLLTDIDSEEIMFGMARKARLGHRFLRMISGWAVATYRRLYLHSSTEPEKRLIRETRNHIIKAFGIYGLPDMLRTNLSWIRSKTLSFFDRH